MRRDYADKIEAIFDGPPPVAESGPEPEPEMPLRDALMHSAKALREAQYKTTGNARRRSQSTNQFPDSITKGNGDGAERVTEPNHTGDACNATQSPNQSTVNPKNSNKGLTRREFLETKIDKVFSEMGGLDGMGTEHQPNDLFKRFAQALRVLGQQMRLGAPLQDLLKKQGINWKLSEDGQALIFFVQNAATGAPQPIARVGYQTLSKPQEFQQQLSSMLDFAKGQAPGTEQQKYEEAQEAMKQLREIAQALAPQDPAKQQGIMQVGMAGGDMGDMQQAAQAPPPAEPATPPAKGVGPITKSSPDKLGLAATKAAGIKPGPKVANGTARPAK